MVKTDMAAWTWKQYRTRLLALTKQHGILVHAEDDEVNLEAPTGWIFGDIHELIHSPSGDETRRDMWKNAYGDLVDNLPQLRKCEDPECEWCEEGRALIGDKD